MNETAIEPIDEPLEELMVEVAPLDAIHEIHILREINRRWRQAALGSIAVGVFLASVAIVQFAGAFITCGLLSEAKEEAARNRKIAEERLGEMRLVEERSGEAARFVELARFQMWKDENERARLLARLLYDFDLKLQKSEAETINRIRARLDQIDADISQARENLEAAESMRILLEKDDKARAKLNPRMYADPKQRCPYDPNPGRKPPMPE